eukprot:GFKZ01003191.1.p1 GENE.GFKZ01003191.1~~GFKZ01003191.1.p1  ORF type:complete len:312 (-),score=54.65 GFKZ01003191.1:620-1555(-)
MAVSFIRPLAMPQVSKRSGGGNARFRCSAQERVVRRRTNVPAVRLRGADRFNFVHNMGTNVFRKGMHEGGVETIFTTPTGRVIDVVSVYELEDEVMVVSCLEEGKLLGHISKYLFPADDVDAEGSVVEVVDVMDGGGGEIEGYVKIGALFGESYFKVGRVDMAKGVLGTEVGEEEWEALRVQSGVPVVGVDVREGDTPLECGMWHLVSFDKGCYMGQETIAKQNTYDGVKRALSLMEFEQEVQVGMTVGGKKEVLTSVSRSSGRWRALGYLDKKRRDVGQALVADGVSGVVVDGRFLRYGFEERSRLALVE